MKHRSFVTLIRIVLPLVLLGTMLTAQAHQGNNHRELSRSALNYLVENDPDFSCAGGLETDLLVGAEDEDTSPRPLFHFDPAEHISSASCTAQQWGLTHTTCTSSFTNPAVNEHSWLDAVEHATDPQSGLPSDAGWLDLGYVLHLLEDMASPAHVRGDSHPFFDPDPFEGETNGVAVGAFNGTLIALGSPAAFFDQLRDLTRSRHFSDDTAFDPNLTGPTAVSEDNEYFYDAAGRRIAYKGTRYYQTCYRWDPVADGLVIDQSACNPRAAAVNRTIAVEQWNELSPIAVQYVASFIRYYYDEASPLITLERNGSFEAGSMAGWTQAQTYGCEFPQYAGPMGPYEVVVSGNVTDGAKSARIGKWTQVYTSGLHGPPLPGEEPCGYNIVYQDIEIPADVSTVELSFDYNVQEYDTANWSWFDMRLVNPTTSGILSNVVSRAGKPGYDYGTYWNGGWVSRSVDLTPWKGQSLRLWFGVHQDGWGDQIATWLDNVKVRCEQ